MLVDKIVVVMTMGAAAFAAGMEVGTEQQKAAVATNCAPQKEEKLSVVVHSTRIASSAFMPRFLRDK